MHLLHLKTTYEPLLLRKFLFCKNKRSQTIPPQPYHIINKYTLQELANLTGLTHGYVKDLECFSIDNTPLLETIGKFANALKIDIRKLFDDTN